MRAGIGLRVFAIASLAVVFAVWGFGCWYYAQLRSSSGLWKESEAKILWPAPPSAALNTGTDAQLLKSPEIVSPTPFYFEYYAGNERFVSDNLSLPTQPASLEALAKIGVSLSEPQPLRQSFRVFYHPEHPNRLAFSSKISFTSAKLIAAAVILAAYSLFGAFACPLLWRLARARKRPRPSGIYDEDWSDSLTAAVWSEYVADTLKNGPAPAGSKKAARGSGVHS